MRVCQTRALGWVDMSHVLAVSKIEWDNGYWKAYVTFAFLDKPREFWSEWEGSKYNEFLDIYEGNENRNCPKFMSFLGDYEEFLNLWKETSE